MSAAGLLRFRGTSVTFAKTSQTYDATAGTMVPSTASVSVYAMRVQGEPKEYASLGLVESEAITLDCDGVPELGATGTFGGFVYTVKAVWPTAPNGTTTRSRVVASR